MIDIDQQNNITPPNTLQQMSPLVPKKSHAVRLIVILLILVCFIGFTILGVYTYFSHNKKNLSMKASNTPTLRPTKSVTDLNLISPTNMSNNSSGNSQEKIQTLLQAIVNPKFINYPDANKYSESANFLFLYENGKRIQDGSVIIYKNNNSPTCKNGVCIIEVISEPITFIKTGQNNVLNYDEWIDYQYLTKPGCEGFAVYKEEIRNSLEDWRNSSEYQQIQKQVDRTQDVTDRNKIWKDSEPHKNSFMKSKGFDFYGNPSCIVNFSDYENIYLKGITQSPLYKILIDIPLQKTVENIQQNNESIPIPGIQWEKGKKYKVDLSSKTFKEISDFNNIDVY